MRLLGLLRLFEADALVPVAIRVGQRVRVRRRGETLDFLRGEVVEVDSWRLVAVVRDDAGHAHAVDLATSELLREPVSGLAP